MVITAANTWGLFLVILFLGYGLVAVPRTLWTAGNPLISLRRAYFTLSKRNMELADEEDKLNELVEVSPHLFLVRLVLMDHLHQYINCYETSLGQVLVWWLTV